MNWVDSIIYWCWDEVLFPSRWSFLLATVGLIGWYLVGEKKRSGWAVGILNQVLFVLYGIAVHQYGFFLTSTWLTAMFARNLLKWKDEEIDIEKLSSILHDVYQLEAQRQDDARHPNKYEDLAENIKEYDRVLARWIVQNFAPKFKIISGE